MKLTFNVQARSRPDKTIETVKLSMEKAVRDDTVCHVCLDDDDPSFLDRAGDFPSDPRIKISIKPREDSRGEKYDRSLKEAPADVYLLGVDHSILLTPGWDQKILDAAALFPDGIGVVNVGGMNNLSFPKLQAVTAKWVELCGFTYNWDYPFWFIDHEIDDLARMTGRVVFADVDVDTTRLRSGNRTQRCRDLKFWTTFFEVFSLWRRNLAHKIIDATSDPEWRKTLLKSWYPMVEVRSTYINQMVYRDADGIQYSSGAGDTPPDPGYLRLFAAAEKKVVAEYERLKNMNPNRFGRV